MEWNDTKKVLPNDREVKLVINSDGKNIVGLGWYNDLLKCWCYYGKEVSKPVTHWMNLPKPPNKK